MSQPAFAELIFVLAMMILLFAISLMGVYFFVRQYRREKKDSENQKLRDIEARKRKVEQSKNTEEL